MTLLDSIYKMRNIPYGFYCDLGINVGTFISHNRGKLESIIIEDKPICYVDIQTVIANRDTQTIQIRYSTDDLTDYNKYRGFHCKWDKAHHDTEVSRIRKGIEAEALNE